jgi:protein gp37
MNKTGISWTDFTLNPLTGCTPISEGCKHCYAAEIYQRHRWDFRPAFHPERLKEINRIPSGSKVFIGSVTDIFHDSFFNTSAGVSQDPLLLLYDRMLSRPDVTFQILTKRPWNAEAFFRDHPAPLHLWIGTSLESRKWLVRVEYLKRIRASVRFLSCEPLLEDLTLPETKLFVNNLDGFRGIGSYLDGIQWVIAGAESGLYRRKFDEQWAVNIMKECRARNIPFFYKQGSARAPGWHDRLEGKEYKEFPEAAQ